MNAELAAPRRWMNRLGGLGLYTLLFALPQATSVVLILKLIASRTIGSPTGMLVTLAVFVAINLLFELTIGRRKGWSPNGAQSCFDNSLTTGEKFDRLQTDRSVWNYLAMELTFVSLLSLAVILFR